MDASIWNAIGLSPYVIAIGLAFIVLWVMSLLFGYLLQEEIAEFTSDLLKRKVEKEARDADLKAFTKA